MAIPVSHALEQRLRRLAEARGQQLDAIIEQAIIHYLDALAITDVSGDDVGQTQLRLADELRELGGSEERFPDEAA